MNLTDDELDIALREWGQTYRDLGSASAEPVTVASVVEARRRPVWPMLAAAAAVLVLAAGVSVFAYRGSGPATMSAGAACADQFSVVEVNEEQSAPPNLGIVLRYGGTQPCRISLRAPSVVLVGADGHHYGRSVSGGRGDRSAAVQPGGEVSFGIDSFLGCRGVPRQKYSLEVGFASGGRLSVPIGVRKGWPSLIPCFNTSSRWIGTVSTLTTSASKTGTVTGRLIMVGGPVFRPSLAVAGTVTFSGPITRTVRASRDGRFSLSLPRGDYHVVGRSPKFNINGAPGRCSARDIAVVSRATVTVRVVCAVK